MLTIYGIISFSWFSIWRKNSESEDKIDRYICSGDRSAAILDFHCICRFYEFAACRGGDPADEGIFRGDADLGHLDHGYDLQLSDGMDLLEYFKSY